MPERKYIHVDDLLLDPLNPRHRLIEAQADLLTFFACQRETRRLAQDIMENGLVLAVSPIVIKTPSIEKEESNLQASQSYTVLDGNRRIAAIKLLRNPEAARNRTAEEAFRKILQRNGGREYIPEEIDCLIVDTREEARIWIERLHTGAKGGIGQMPWSAVQQARFDRVKYPLSRSFLRFLQRFDLISDNYPISTLERILDSAKNYMQYEIDEDGITFFYDEQELRKFGEKIFSHVEKGKDDTGNPIDSRALRTKEDVERYLERIGLPRGNRDNATAPIKIPLDSPPHTYSKAKQSTPRKNQSIVPSELKLSPKSTSIRVLWQELKKINPSKFPYATAFLIRGLLAVGSYEFCKAHMQDFKLNEERLRKLGVQKCLKKINKYLFEKKIILCRDKENIHRFLTDQDSNLSIFALHDSSHLAGHAPSRDDLQKIMEKITPLLKGMIEDL